VVVTADREPEPISRTGSSIGVIKGETLATSNPGSLVDVLRTVPGVGDVAWSSGRPLGDSVFGDYPFVYEVVGDPPVDELGND